MIYSIFTFFTANSNAGTLDDFPMLSPGTGTWEGVGIGFGIEKGKVSSSQTFSDSWDGTSMMRDRWLVVNGTVTLNNESQKYRWDFKIDRLAEIPTVRATYRDTAGFVWALIGTLEDPSGVLRLRTDPKHAEDSRGISPKAKIEIDVSLDGMSIIVESRWLDEHGTETYRAAARYHKTSTEKITAN